MFSFNVAWLLQPIKISYSMQYRKFGNTDLQVSEIGFGAWAIGGGAMIGNTAIGWGDADDAVSVKAIHAATESGINFFDTADIYGLGHSEELIGKELGQNKNIIIATKAGNVSRNEQFTIDYTKEYILEACESSLKRLKRDVIDYYQLHTARITHLQNGECIEAMQQLQQQGKIRYWGLSLNTFEPNDEAAFLMKQSLGNGFQLVLNIINQKAIPLLQAANEKGYGVIARMPLQFGLLTGKFDKLVNFTDNDHRKNRLTKEVINETLEATAPVWQLCKKYNCTKTQLALSYILSYPQVSTIITGIRTPEQVLLNTEKLFLLEEADKLMIEDLGVGVFIKLMDLIKKQG
jgi:aryl-alcohol dehydrogenase-like predicted oxidoreductase